MGVETVSDRRRKQLRIPGYDYRHPGGYFVTVCTEKRLPHFGEIVDQQVVLSAAGKMVKDIWSELTNKFPGLEIDEFVMMPNHLHGILIIHPVGADLRAMALDGLVQGRPRPRFGNQARPGRTRRCAPTRDDAMV